MNYHYRVIIPPTYNERSVKVAIIDQNFEWFKKGELMRIEYVDTADQNGDRSNYEFILTGVPVSANVYPLHKLLRSFLLSLEDESNFCLPLDALVAYDLLTPKEVQGYYSDLKGSTNYEFFEDYSPVYEEIEISLYEKLEALYFDLSLEYLLDDEMQSIYHDYKSKINCEFTADETHKMEEIKAIAILGRDPGTYTVPKATTDRDRIYYKGYHVSSGIETVILPNYEEATGMSSVINNRAFAGCDTLLEVLIFDVIGKKLENGDIIDDSSFGEGVFSKCSGLETVGFYNDYTYIPHSTFEDCESLKEVFVSSLLSEIGDSAFFGCTALNYTAPRCQDTILKI